MVKKTFNASIIGVGRIGFSLQFDKKREQPASHSLALKKNRNMKIISACDKSKERLEQWKKYYKNTNIYTKQDDFFKNEKPDIIVIAVNESDHLKTTLNAIKRKPKLIILEKPVAPNLEEACLIKRYSKKFDVPICINHERRHSLDYKIVKELIRKNKLGIIESVNGYFWSSAPIYKKDSEKSGNCSLIHDGTHLIDILSFLFDVKFSRPKIGKISMDNEKNVRFLNILYNEKISGSNKKTLFSLEFSGNKKIFGFELDIKGTTGRIIIGNGYLKFYERKSSPFYKGFYSLVKNSKVKRPVKTRYFSNMISNCVDFLNGKSELISDLSSGIKTLKMIYKIITKIKKSFDF